MNTNSFTFKLTSDQQHELLSLLKNPKYQVESVPHTQIAVAIQDCRINLYTSGKLLVQGKVAREWVTFTLEPEILKEAVVGYEDFHDPEAVQPHMGIDESGKGDFFGPLVIASAYVDEALVNKLRELGVRDSKKISSDNVALNLARDIRKVLGDRCAMVTIGPRSYNRMYTKIRNVNKMLAWGHARAIENLLRNGACFAESTLVVQAVVRDAYLEVEVRRGGKPRSTVNKPAAPAGVDGDGRVDSMDRALNVWNSEAFEYRLGALEGICGL